MGYREAVEEGIRHAQNPGELMTRYYPKCHICGGEVMSLNYKRGSEYTCRPCKLENLLADEGSRCADNFEVKERKFQNAAARITKMVPHIEKYDEALNAVREKLHKSGWFDSTEEIMTAIELVKKKIPTRHQVKLGRYKLDFVLPDEKIVLEIDGHIYHTDETRNREILRDDLIVLKFGLDWDVIRISDTLVNQNITRLVPAFRAVKRKRAKLREQNNGKIPEWYSDRKL